MNFWRAFKTPQSYLTFWVIIAGESPALYYFSIEFPTVRLMPLYYIKLSSQQHHQIRMRTRRSLFCNAHWFFSYASHWFSVGSFSISIYSSSSKRERERVRERAKKIEKDNFLISLNVSFIKESSWKINE